MHRLTASFKLDNWMSGRLLREQMANRFCLLGHLRLLMQVNYFLMTLTVLIVLLFQSSTNLSSAYGELALLDQLAQDTPIFLLVSANCLQGSTSMSYSALFCRFFGVFGYFVLAKMTLHWQVVWMCPSYKPPQHRLAHSLGQCNNQKTSSLMLGCAF